MARRIHVLFDRRQVIDRSFSDAKKLITAGVWIDLDLVDEVIRDASHNKSRKAHRGALGVEVHSIEPLDGKPLIACR